MADDVTTNLILEGDSSGADKSLDKVNKGIKRLQGEVGHLTDDSVDAAVAMVKAAQKAEAANRQTEDSLKRIIARYKEVRESSTRAEAAVRNSSGGGAFKAGAADIAREIGGSSPFAPVLEGLAELTPAGIAAGAATTLAALAFSKLQEVIESSRQAAEDRAKQVLANAEIEVEATRLLRDNQYAAAKALADSQLAEQTKLQGDIQRLEGLRDAAQAEYDATNDLARKLLARGDIDEYQRQIDEKRTEFNATSEKVVSAYTVLNSELGKAAQQAEKYQTAVAEFVKTEEERQRVAAQTEAAIANLTKQEQALNEAYTRSAIARSVARGIADADAREDEKNRASDAAEDLALALEQQAAAHESAMLAISKRGDDAILAAQQALADKQVEAAEQVAAIQDQLRQDTIKAEAAFNKQRLRDQREYRQALAALESKYEKQRFDSILNNDVLAFLEAGSQYKGDRRNLREDRRDERADARQDFNDEQAEREQAAAARIAEIEAELAAFTASTAAKIAEIERQTQIELDLAQKAYDAKLAYDQKLRDIQTQRDERDSQIKADRQQRDRDREDAAARLALQASLDRITEQKDAQTAALDILTAKAKELQQIAASIQFPTPTGSAGVSVPVPTSGTPYVPTPGSEKFYEDPGQGPVGQSGGGGFGAGLNGISSAGAARGGAPNVQFNITSAGAIGGREVAFIDDVQREVVKALTQYHTMLTSELGTQEGRRG